MGECTICSLEIWPKVLFFTITFLSVSQSTRLNTPKLLFPHSSRVSINFTIAAENGCYEWQSSRPETVSVHPLSASKPPSVLQSSTCSQQVLVSALSASSTLNTSRTTSIIRAEDPVTGHTLLCEVIVSHIRQIQILTTTRHVFTDEPPLELAITALDSEGNTFSSVSGLQFVWRIAKDPDAAEVIRFVSFSETGYFAPHHIVSLEEAGQRGDRVLLEGLSTGIAQVQVWLSDPEYKSVKPATVSIVVTDRLHLSPSQDIYLLPGSTLLVHVWKSGPYKNKDVTLSVNGYQLSVERAQDEDGDVITVDQDTATVTAVQKGHATLTLSHPSLVLSAEPLVPRCSIFVVDPSYLTLLVEEEANRWVLEVGRHYHLRVHVHDQEGHVVNMPNNVVLTVEMSDSLFYVLESSANNTFHVVETYRPGHTVIKASLLSIVIVSGSQTLPLTPPITVHQEVEIYEPLILKPPLLVLPWQPEGHLYQHHIQVEGGSGAVSWSESDSNVAVVTVKGDVIAGKKLGQTEIQAADMLNPRHTATGQVFVLRPAHVELLPQRGDCRVGETIMLPMAVWGERQGQASSQGTTYQNSPMLINLLEVTDCSLMKLHVTTQPTGVFVPAQDPVGRGPGYCAGLQMEAVGPGHTLVTVTIEADQYNISSMATLAAHTPLRASVSEVVLSVRASCLIIFEAGPKPWPLVPARFYSNIHIIDSKEVWEGLEVETVSQSEPRKGQQHAFRVTCLALGEQWLVFTSGNTPGPLNEQPSKEESRVKVACSSPASLSLSLLPFSPSSSSFSSSILSSFQPKPCPQSQHATSMLSVSYNRGAELQLAVFDQQGVQFDNFSSCLVHWHSSNSTLLSLPVSSHMVLADTLTASGLFKLHGRQVLHAHGHTGVASITVTLTLVESLFSTPLTTSMQLRLVKDIQWSRHTLTLYNHPEITDNLTIVHGSGHYIVHLQDKELANITYMEDSNVIQVSPTKPGVSSLLAYDLCVASGQPAVASLSVSEISGFQIDFVDIVEVHHSALVVARVLNSNREPFPQASLALMHLKLIPSSEIITVEPAGPLDRVSVGYRVLSHAVGVVSLHLSAVDSRGGVHTSSHKQLQVYPKFTLQPRSLALAVGSIRQVKWEGGPQPQSRMGLSVSDTRIATVTDTGLVCGIAVGVVKIRGALQTVTQDSGALLTFAQDEIDVEVFSLTAVRIQAPLVQLFVGTEMPVYVMGSDSSQNPLALGSVESGLLFHWSLGNPGVVDIQPRHTQAGVTVSPAHSFSVLVKARVVGRTSLRVTVELANHTVESPQQLSDEIQLVVFQEMQLKEGTTRSILMSPYSQYTLQSNKDTICPVRYALCQCVKGQGLVTVDSQGVLRTGPDTGSALLEVIAVETCGVSQTLLISVQVSPVWFVRLFMLSPHSVRGRSQPAFPLGWTIRVRALLYDNLGQQFHAHNINTHILTNRDDLVQVIPDSDGHSFVVQTVSAGLTVLGVQGEPTNPSLSDYTPLTVLPAIAAPPQSFKPGDLFCFSTLLTGDHGQLGQWAVSSDQMLLIDPETGAALAKHPGTVVVYYKLGGQQALKEVNVDSPVIPTLLPPVHGFLTNWPNASYYSVLVEMHTNVKNTASCTLSQRKAIERKLHPEAELHCTLHFSAPYLQLNILQAVFEASPHYDPDTGAYSCRVSVQPQEESVLQMLSTLPLTISLSASLRSQSPLPLLPLLSLSQPLSGHPVKLPYLPAFHCPMSALSLTGSQPKAELTVMGTKDMLSSLKFHSSSPDVVLSEPRHFEESSSVVLSVSTSWDRVRGLPHPTTTITVNTSLTQQTCIITVTVRPASQMSTG
ncbi:nuclear pore membrane glycoprotein 210 [Myripristis murdjan]|uniref:nuclear pore membrane glycoprotein 210 n=1 Tax=Myripristis murdjan TaxID=586833 RepID=UPI0011760BEE|nr:nuclear pore membrane glycoprotein 210-like [Myripristis murdjan]